MIDINGDTKLRQYFQETKKVEINLALVDKCKTPRSLILDLSQTNAMLELPNSKAMLYCQAWAKNIDTERSFVDKVITKCQ